jgi:mitochondrial cardiolipin hydrolase
MKESLPPQVFFSSSGSIAETVRALIEASELSVHAALYRFNNPDLVKALSDCARRGVSVRVVLDRGKYDDDKSTQRLMTTAAVPFRTMAGKHGPGSKLHHKFAVVDGRAVMTGSYNWTLESEQANYENLVVLRAPETIDAYCREFDAVWDGASVPSA